MRREEVVEGDRAGYRAHVAAGLDLVPTDRYAQREHLPRWRLHPGLLQVKLVSAGDVCIRFPLVAAECVLVSSAGQCGADSVGEQLGVPEGIRDAIGEESGSL